MKHILIAILSLFRAAVAFGAPPNTPTIISPVSDGATVNGADVHMETSAFSERFFGQWRRARQSGL
jgi:hypothetical protein